MVGKKTAILEKAGIYLICEHVEEGKSQDQISKIFGVNQRTLNDFLNRPEHISQHRLAIERSAESWLDKGLAVIESALFKESGVDATAARAYAQECARRASIRNRAYNEKRDIKVSGGDGPPIEIRNIKRVVIEANADTSEY